METLSVKSWPVWAYLQLTRPANIVTAWADILVGYAVAGSLNMPLVIASGQQNLGAMVSLGWLLLATTGLYGGGVVFNDVFDAELDRVERPERPLPSGTASRLGAITLGSALLILGILAAAQVSWTSAGLAIAIAGVALVYDAVGKHQGWLGSLNMGGCRGGNLLLGMSVAPEILTMRWFIALIPVMYITAVTAISQGEVAGGQRQTGLLALSLMLVTLLSVLGLGHLNNYDGGMALPYTLLLAGLVLPNFGHATLDPSPAKVQQAVKSGVLSLIVLDAAIAAGFAPWPYGLVILLLLPLSLALALVFAVT